MVSVEESATGVRTAEYGGSRPDYADDTRFPVEYFDTITAKELPTTIAGTSTLVLDAYRSLKVGGQFIVPMSLVSKNPFLLTLLDDTKLLVKKDEQELRCAKLRPTRLQILLPPGIGDSYWSIVKLQSFLSTEHILEPPNITLVSTSENYASHSRSLGFIEMFPFLKSDTGVVIKDVNMRSVWREAYMMPGRTIFNRVWGKYDYLISYNGHLRVGKRLEDVDPWLTCNWHPPMFVSLEQEQFRTKCIKDFGPYFVCYFPVYGSYNNWKSDFDNAKVAESINNIAMKTHARPLFVGAKWDFDNAEGGALVSSVKDVANIMGKTSVAQMFGALRGAEFVVGYPSGMTILAAKLGVKTLIVWNHYYNKDFAWNCAPPDVRKQTYFIDWTYKLTPDRLVSEVVDLVETGCVDENKYPRLIPDALFKVQIPSKPPTHTSQRPVTFNQLRGYDTKKQEAVVKPPVESVAVKRLEFRRRIVPILCVLKMGGEYNLNYVVKLKNMVARNVTIPYRFICLTDAPLASSICETLPLQSNLQGWWSKLELFRPGLVDCGSIVYFDLDTVLVGNIDYILQLRTNFAALGAWNPVPNRSAPTHFGSGMMVWNNSEDFSFLLNEFNGERYRMGDQEYIVKSLMSHNVQYETLQDLVPGIYSYKRNCLRALPVDARVVCFHGKPRPHQALHVKWVKNNWR